MIRRTFAALQPSLIDIRVTLNKLKFMLNVLGVVPEAMLVKLLCVFLKVVGQNGSHLSSYKKDIDTLAVELIHIPEVFHCNSFTT